MLLLGVKLCDLEFCFSLISKDMMFLVRMGRMVFISDFEEMCSRVPGFVPGLPWVNLLLFHWFYMYLALLGVPGFPGCSRVGLGGNHGFV